MTSLIILFCFCERDLLSLCRSFPDWTDGTWPTLIGGRLALLKPKLVFRSFSAFFFSPDLFFPETADVFALFRTGILPLFLPLEPLCVFFAEDLSPRLSVSYKCMWKCIILRANSFLPAFPSQSVSDFETGYESLSEQRFCNFLSVFFFL